MTQEGTSMREIIAADVVYASDVDIEVDSAMSTVSIGGADGIFLQGHEADDFVERARALYEELGDVTMPEVYAHLAKPYIDCLD
ncbi:hypothetical protein F6X40_23730 [Paraburkholderia sp. UCT31]|uniref:hypothetical protein n=1 Tax=Paraburkholderia sp. UCT31 TaxID=2615209 RepID=UPI001655EC3A|nr:hypothetical protein [Paraburkholderia sp. UCT31]MBC8739727.1 hypothetical protein [Paraburkholderia sp. UCT31]